MKRLPHGLETKFWADNRGELCGGMWLVEGFPDPALFEGDGYESEGFGGEGRPSHILLDMGLF